MKKETVDSEKVVERKLVELVKINGGMCIKLLCDQLIGLPDRMCLFPGHKIVFVAYKHICTISLELWALELK